MERSFNRSAGDESKLFREGLAALGVDGPPLRPLLLARLARSPGRTVLELQHGDPDDERRREEDRSDEEGEVIAARERGRRRLALRDEVVAACRGEGRQYREPERAADLGRRVDEPGGEARVLAGGPG